jgi:hypothetical protein
LNESDFDCLVGKNNTCTFFIDKKYKGIKNNSQIYVDRSERKLTLLMLTT